MKLLFAALLSVGMLSEAFAGSVTQNETVNVRPPPLVTTLTGIMAECTWPPGTVIATYATSGGNGNPITWTLTGDTTDFALVGTPPIVGPTASVAIGSTGIATANCGKPNVFTVTATQ